MKFIVHFLVEPFAGIEYKDTLWLPAFVERAIKLYRSPTGSSDPFYRERVYMISLKGRDRALVEQYFSQNQTIGITGKHPWTIVISRLGQMTVLEGPSHNAYHSYNASRLPKPSREAMIDCLYSADPRFFRDINHKGTESRIREAPA